MLAGATRRRAVILVRMNRYSGKLLPIMKSLRRTTTNMVVQESVLAAQQVFKLMVAATAVQIYISHYKLFLTLWYDYLLILLYTIGDITTRITENTVMGAR